MDIDTLCWNLAHQEMCADFLIQQQIKLYVHE